MNRLHLAYDSVTGVAEAAAPDVIFITGRGNRYNDAFQQARAKGATVLAYWNPLEIPMGSTNAQDLEQWMGDTAIVPRWKFSGVTRSNYLNTELADITPGSSYRQYFATITETMMRKGLFDGFFCDTLGAKPWKAGYDGWPMEEQIAWTTYAADVAREQHEIRMRVNPDFQIIHNNYWALASTHPAAAIAKTGTQYSNGGCLENTPYNAQVFTDTGVKVPQAFHIAYATKTFGASPRRMLLIAPTAEYALEWLKYDGPTHVAVVQSYKQVVPLPATVATAIEAMNLRQQLVQAQADLAATQAALSAKVALLDTLTQERDAAEKQLLDVKTAGRQFLATFA